MGLIAGFHERRGHIIAIHREGILGKWIGFVWLLLSIASLVKTEVLPFNQQEKWQFVHMIPAISLAWWVAISALLLFVWVLEASFRYAKKNQIQLAEAQDKAKKLEEELKSRPNKRHEILNEVFTKTQQIQAATPKTKDELTANIEHHQKWMQDILKGTLSDAEINVLIHGPSEPLQIRDLTFGFAGNQLSNYLYNLEKRIGNVINKT